VAADVNMPAAAAVQDEGGISGGDSSRGIGGNGGKVSGETHAAATTRLGGRGCAATARPPPRRGRCGSGGAARPDDHHLFRFLLAEVREAVVAVALSCSAGSLLHGMRHGGTALEQCGEI